MLACVLIFNWPTRRVYPTIIIYNDVTQGGLLLIIYLTSLDEFIDKLKENYARGPEPRRIYYVRYAD